MNFELYLTKKSMKEWSLDNHKFRTFWMELRGDKEGIIEIMNSELKKQDAFRNAIKKSLGDEYSDQKSTAERWALVLKNKATILDAWSFLFTAMITLYTIAVTGFTVVSLYFGKDRPIELLLFLLSLNMIIVVWKFGVDKRSSWYKQITHYLDSIAKVEKHLTNASTGPLCSAAAPQIGPLRWR